MARERCDAVIGTDDRSMSFFTDSTRYAFEQELKRHVHRTTKLSLGMSLFVVFFVVAFLVFPARAYREYFEDVRRRQRGSLVKVLLAVLYGLSLPYFYDELVGLDSKTLSRLLQVAMGACAYGLLIDVARFVYKNYGPPTRRPGRARK